MKTKKKPEWVLEADDDGEFIRFEGAGDLDESFTVYLPDSKRQSEEHGRAIQVILEALNGAGVVVE